MLTIGNKYQETRNLSCAAVAKLVRADIKEAMKAGQLPGLKKVSVRSDRNSIWITIMDCDCTIANPARVAFEQVHGIYEHTSIPLFAPEAVALKEALAAILNAYNRQDVDSMADYYNVAFYGSVDFSWDLRNACKDRQIAAQIEATKPRPALYLVKPLSYADQLAACFAE